MKIFIVVPVVKNVFNKIGPSFLFIGEVEHMLIIKTSSKSNSVKSLSLINPSPLTINRSFSPLII